MNRQKNAAGARRDANSDNVSRGMAGESSQLPAWNRERLIRQFQDIDGSTRSDAEMQIDAFERSFWGVFPGSIRKRATPDDASD